MSRFARQQASAQAALDHASPPETDGDALDAILAAFCEDRKKIAEADEWNDGMQSGDHYTAVEIALADLGEVSPDRLIGSDALATVLRLAKVHSEAREAKLREMAQDELNRRIAQDEADRSEAMGYLREDAA